MGPDTQAKTFPCPLCNTPLPLGAEECTSCDWVKGYRHNVPVTSGDVSDWVAVGLSIVPGLGHIFKGHYWTGVGYLVASVVFVFFVGAGGMVAMGFNLLLLPLYWIWVGFHAYLTPDLEDHMRSFRGPEGA